MKKIRNNTNTDTNKVKINYYLLSNKNKLSNCSNKNQFPSSARILRTGTISVADFQIVDRIKSIAGNLS